MKKSLRNLKRVGVDTNFFIYYFQKHPHFGPVVKSVLNLFAEHQTMLITSIIAMTELLSFKASEVLIIRLEEDLMLMDNLQLMEVNCEVAKKAARIRREFGFTLADAIQLATALENNAEVFLTNDKKLQHFKELKIILLSSL